jgi:Spx/MgsR family transcriptional regulator
LQRNQGNALTVASGLTSSAISNLGQLKKKTSETSVTGKVPPMLTLYGLKACDTCRKARQMLEKAGKDVTFVDVRETALTPDQIAIFAQNLGDALINKRSTTWRELSENERNQPAEALIARFPTVMKRPVIEEKGALTLGWDAKTQAKHLGNT